MKSRTAFHPSRAFQAAFRTAGLVALLTLGALFVQQAQAGCGQFSSAKPTASNWRPFGDEPGSARLIKASFLKVADDETPTEDWGHHDARIVGLWQFKYTAEGNVGAMVPPNGTVIDGGNTLWYADGNELTSSAMRAPDTGSICVGVWKQTGERTYELNHIGQSWDPAKNVYVGPAFIKQYVTLEKDGDKYSGVFFLTQYAADGKTVLIKLKGLIAATRVTVDTQ